MKSQRTSAFTLIELLLVIAIIAILAALLLTGLGAARRTGLKAQGNSIARQVATAFCSYYNQYGQWPSTNSVYIDQNCISSLSASNSSNPKGIDFLNLSPLPTNTEGRLIDPCGAAYQFKVSLNGMLGNVGTFIMMPGTTTATVSSASVAVWSTNKYGYCTSW
jgi:prepilin-type N-terminal cleavage/methylation domain-containing protein